MNIGASFLGPLAVDTFVEESNSYEYFDKGGEHATHRTSKVL